MKIYNNIYKTVRGVLTSVRYCTSSTHSVCAVCTAFTKTAVLLFKGAATVLHASLLLT